MTSPPQADPEITAAGHTIRTIRAMTSADINALLALEQSIPEAPHWSRHDYETILATPAEGASLTRAALVAERDSQLAGFCVMRQLRLHESSNHPATIHCELESIVVAAPSRKLGIGLELMRAILELAATAGADRLELEVRATNHPAIGLYTRAGLTPQGRRPAYYSDPVDDALLMAKEVSPKTSHP